MLLTTELDKLSGTDWQLFFAQERAKPYFAELDAFVTAAAAEKAVYPAAETIFAAFRACPVSAVRVVILGQDPYHEPGQAMGLSFSVPDGCKAPPSLRNIFKELEAELGPGCAAHTDLTLWARQGVLLLNTVLTVEQGAANAHAGRGWETFTRAALEYAAAHGTAPLAAVLWGTDFQQGCRPSPGAGAGIRPPQPAVGLPRVLRLGAVRQGECVFKKQRCSGNRLVSACKRNPRLTD